MKFSYACWEGKADWKNHVGVDVDVGCEDPLERL
jgi:hypothetical protein